MFFLVVWPNPCSADTGQWSPSGWHWGERALLHHSKYVPTHVCTMSITCIDVFSCVRFHPGSSLCCGSMRSIHSDTQCPDHGSSCHMEVSALECVSSIKRVWGHLCAWGIIGEGSWGLLQWGLPSTRTQAVTSRRAWVCTGGNDTWTLTSAKKFTCSWSFVYRVVLSESRSSIC